MNWKIPFIAVTIVAIVTACILLSQSSFPRQNTSAEHPDWNLLVDGLVQHPLNLSLKEIVTMPRRTISAELYCLPSPEGSGVLVDSGNWTGVSLRFMLEKAGVLPEAVKVAFYAEDGFTTDLAMSPALGEDILLAYEKEGEPLHQKLRLVVPGRWGYKWIYLLNRIELVDYDFLGTYESRGFPDRAEIP
ncbi:MAG: molybdopterin-dependent oxidoreductase [Candidatus Bathyarchaeota archaeon]|nr:molybdopterin-dependent oxidoreductase [Candidatus Bathyarchaeota archaeon]MDH5745787.1 molybdopterin-dependent oxidoreductase [Candidatus Bathyarchaeota archaeon]